MTKTAIFMTAETVVLALISYEVMGAYWVVEILHSPATIACLVLIIRSIPVPSTPPRILSLLQNKKVESSSPLICFHPQKQPVHFALRTSYEY